MDGNTVALPEGRVGTRCVVLQGGRKMDGMDGNTVAALVVRRAELDRDTVNSAAGRERGGWDGREHGGSAGSGESGAG